MVTMPTTTKLRTLTPSDLPSPPDVAMRIVRACGDPAVSNKELREIIGSDSTLTMELLRIVNAPFFGLRQPVTRMEQVLVVLGHRRLRNIALLFIARETLRLQTISSAELRGYWEESLRRAVAAKLLAQVVSVDSDDAFTLGMLQDIGLLALFTVQPLTGDAWRDLRRATPDQRRRKEQEAFGAMHTCISKLLAERWSLPEELALPMTHHHDHVFDDLPPYIRKLCQLAHCADWFAAVYSASDKRLALARCRQLLAEYFGIDHEAADQLLSGMPEAVTAAAAALGISISEQPQFDAVLANANRWMMEEHSNRDELIHSLESALREREQLADELQCAYERLSQWAYYDPLTMLVNRRRFDELFNIEIIRHGRSSQHLSVMMLDLDSFKLINDTYGHQLGDTVLQAVAEAIKRSLRATDVAARIGGDEVCVLLPDTPAEGAKIAAERVRAALAALRFEAGLTPLRITSSIGGSTWCGSGGPGTHAGTVRESIISGADKALYHSKHKGRNQVSWAG